MGGENKKKECVRFVASHVRRCTIFVSLSLSPQTPSAVLPTAGHIPGLVVCVFHSRTNVVSSGLPFFFLVCYPVLVPVPVPVPVPDERRPGNAFPCASTCYVYRG